MNMANNDLGLQLFYFFIKIALLILTIFFKVNNIYITFYKSNHINGSRCKNNCIMSRVQSLKILTTYSLKLC